MFKSKMGELDGWYCAFQHLKSAYKDESVISNLAIVNYSDDVIDVDEKELVNIDENLSFRSCIPIDSDKYEVGSLSDEMDIDEQMPGIIDVSSIHDDDSHGDRMQFSFRNNYKLDISELEEKPAQSIKCFKNGYDDIHSMEDLSDGAGSGSETDESSIILNVWNEDYEGNPDPVVLEKLMKAKHLPRNLDPAALTRIKRAKIINQIMELEDEDSSQGSCAVMFDHICGPKFCADGDITDEESLARNSLVESVKQDSLAGSIDSEIFQFKRPKRSKYALIPDKKFNPKSSPEQLVLRLPRKKDDLKSATERDSFLPIQYSTLDDEESEDHRTYVEKEMEFTLQKYDRTPGRIAQLVLSGKKSEAKVSYSDASTDLTGCNLFSEIPDEIVSLDKYVMKERRFVHDGDPIEGDRSIVSHNSDSSVVLDEELETPFSEFVKIFSDPDFKIVVKRSSDTELITDCTETKQLATDVGKQGILEENGDVCKQEIFEEKESFEEDAKIQMDEIGGGHVEDLVASSEEETSNRDTIETGDHEEVRMPNIKAYAYVDDSDKPGDFSVETSCSENSDNDVVPIPSYVTDADDIPLNPVGSSYSFKENCVCSMSFQTEIKKGKGFDESCDEIDGLCDRRQQFVERRSSLVASFLQQNGNGDERSVHSEVYSLPINKRSDASAHCSNGKNVISECCNSGVPNSTTEDGVNDLIDALDTALQLQVTNTASYSTVGGEEVVIAMPVEGILVEQPKSQYGRIIPPDEFEKLQSSYCESMKNSPEKANELPKVTPEQDAENTVRVECGGDNTSNLVTIPSEDFSIDGEQTPSFKTPLSTDSAAFSFGTMQSPCSLESASPGTREAASIREELEDDLLQVNSMIAELKNESFVMNEEDETDSKCLENAALSPKGAKKFCLPKLPSTSKIVENSYNELLAAAAVAQDLSSKQASNTAVSHNTSLIMKSHSFPITSTTSSDASREHPTEQNDKVEPSIIDDLKALKEKMAKRRSISEMPTRAAGSSSHNSPANNTQKKPFQLYV